MKLLSELVTIITQIPESRLLKVPTSADEGKLPVIRADKIPAVYHDTTLAAIVIEGDKVIDKISGKELTKVGSPQIIDGGIHSPTNSDYYMLELEGVEGLPVAVSFDYQGDESPADSSNIVTINGNCAYYSINGVSFCRSQGRGNNIKIDNQPVGISEAYRNYVMQVSSDNYESKTPPVAFIAGESKSPTYEGSFPSMSPLSSVKICGRFGKIRNILIGSAFPYTGNFTPRGDGVEGFGVPEKREPGWNYETLDEAANGRLLPANPANGDIPCFDATATVGGGIDDDTHLMLHFDEESGIPADSSQVEILVTANDTAADAATAKFGKARNLNNSYLSLTCPAMATGTGDFTYEGWFYFNELNKRRGLFGVDMGLYVALWGDNTFGVAISTSGSSWNYNHMDSNRSEATATQGVWQHIALVRNKGNVTLYLNGNSILSFDIGADTVITGNMGNNPFRIGYPLGGMSSVADFCDEFRFSTVARWTGNFTPPDAPYSKQVIEGEWGKLNKSALVQNVNGQIPDGSGVVTLPEATTSAAGLMAAADKAKLDELNLSNLADIATKAHTHANKATLDKLAETDGKLTFDGAEIGGSVQITVDSELSSTSTNPVQNKVVKAALDGKGSGGIFYQNVFQSESIEIYLNPDYPIYQYTLLDTDNRVDLLVDNIDLTKGCITVELQLTKPVTNTNSITVRVRNKGTLSAKTVKWLDSTQSITTQGTYSIVIRTFDGTTWYANIAYLI